MLERFSLPHVRKDCDGIVNVENIKLLSQLVLKIFILIDQYTKIKVRLSHGTLVTS